MENFDEHEEEDFYGSENDQSHFRKVGNKSEPWLNVEIKDSIDEKMGFTRFTGGDARTGWLVNMQEVARYFHPRKNTLVKDSTFPDGKSAIEFYFIQEDGSTFKATLVKSPYFLLACKNNEEASVEEYLRRRFERLLEKIVRVTKEDLDLPNHLLGLRKTFLQLYFRNNDDMQEVKKSLMPSISANQKSQQTESIYKTFQNNGNQDDEKADTGYLNAIDEIIDIREHDVPYIARIAIDYDFRVGLWYSISEDNGVVEVNRQFDKVLPADPIVMAFDIETSKSPLKFPDSTLDQIMMISYMIDRQGYLITNRDIVSADIDDFEYSPKPGEYDGPFIIFNEADEKSLLRRWFDHIRNVKPTVVVTYNGDFFDWPFIETRAKIYDFDLYQEIGWFKTKTGDYCSSYASHMDCFRWVKRDSYLPVGSQGLKSVTKCKLGYDPKELDPELMTPYATSHPHILADYSVSDAVATYYLYMKYVHPFIFSLCNIIPLAPDDVLRKGSGTLCEMLLMVEAFKAEVIMPNKHREISGKFFDGHYLQSETYVGGHVEALESGVFRSDLPTHFRIDPAICQNLINDLDRALRFSIEVEERKKVSEVVNFNEVKAEIQTLLEELRDNPCRNEEPLIYHLDVAAMYPNIILTNRLQPPALVNEETCALCDFNQPSSNCQRKMKWSWRGEFYPAERSEYNMIRNQLEAEKFPPKWEGGEPRSWNDLRNNEQTAMIQKRLSQYSRKVYNKIHETKVEEKKSIVCQRENSFYVDTVRNFRDRRYEYKGKLKEWKKKLETSVDSKDLSRIEESKKMVVLMDSLQLAHKCILNSFYGYVMRKGSRWYSMEMAGIVCLTGAKIIQMARRVVEKIGRPLELDTDGIWCILPKSFPETFRLKLSSGKEIKVTYPCIMLNHLVHDEFTNDQYQVLVDPDNLVYETKSENSIFFEIDGPYRAMILPASKEENKLLKKRYAVFNDDGSLAELKGFEVKRRGELKVIKIFQEEVFKEFLKGNSLKECYAQVAKVADRWLDVLFTRGRSVSDEELLEYISENRSMSKTLEEYGTQKSTSITTAKRLSELLGAKMVQDKGLACKFIIALKPQDAPVAERAIPVVIFSMEESIKFHYLRKWLKDPSLSDLDIRTILDWTYYIERVGSTIQKLVTIPAAMQHVANPIPRLPHPDWLLKRVNNLNNDSKQRKITDSFFKKTFKASIDVDMEDFGVSKISDVFTIVDDVEDDVKSTKMQNASPKKIVQKPEVKPDVFTQYHDWIEYQKKKWKVMRETRKNRVSGQLGKNASGVFSYLANQKRSIMSFYWEIIQIFETETAGTFKVWALVDKSLVAFRYNINRVFYVNCRVPDDTGKAKRVYKVLPRSLKSFYLYEFNMPELEFVEHADMYRNFTWHHDTIGVFETNIPLDFRMLFGLSNICTTNPKTVAKKSTESMFCIDDFVKTKNMNASYLSSKNVNFAFVYHSQSDARQVFGFFFLSKGVSEVFVVDSKGNEAVPNLAKLYKDKLMENPDTLQPDSFAPGFNYPDSIKFNTYFVSDEKKAFKSIQKLLGDFQLSRPGPTLFLLNSPRSIKYFCAHAKIFHEFPSIPFAFNKRDNLYPSLDWQRFASQRMIKALTYARELFVDKLLLARYAEVPISSIDDEPLGYISDLLLSRILAERDIVSWYSPSVRPDLGGREDDDNIFTSENLIDLEINFQSHYCTVCIEYDIEDLAINTVLQSSFINENEGSDAHAGLSNSELVSVDKQLLQTGEIVDENAPSFKAFKCVKDLVRQWAKDFHLHSDPIARVLLKNFYRWISNSNSRMFDPSIHAHIHSLMKKLLMQILAEFKKLGSNVVFASFSKIIVVTSKVSVDTAKAYNDFVIKTIRSKDAFAFIDIKCKTLWKNLVWYDSMNYAGLCLDTNDLKQDQDGNANDDESQLLKLSMEWSTLEFLPLYLRKIFTEIVSEYIEKIHEIQGSNELVLDQSRKSEQLENVKKLIREYFTRKLLDIIPNVQNVFSGISGIDVPEEDLKFPQIPSASHCLKKKKNWNNSSSSNSNNSNNNNAALELVKIVCMMLSLNPHVQYEVLLMRRTLLRLVGVGEFSGESEFINPCFKVILPCLTCSFCQHSRDVNIAFDNYASMNVNVEKKMNVKGWRCSECFHEYNNGMIEERLVNLVHRELTGFQMSDLKCRKCKRTKRENIRLNCKVCAEGYEIVNADTLGLVNQNNNSSNSSSNNTSNNCDEKMEIMRQKLEILSQVSEMNGLEYLRNVVDWTINKL